MVYDLVYDASLWLLNLNGAGRRSYDPSPQGLSVSHTGRIQLMCLVVADESNGLVRA